MFIKRAEIIAKLYNYRLLKIYSWNCLVAIFKPHNICSGSFGGQLYQYEQVQSAEIWQIVGLNAHNNLKTAILEVIFRMLL